MSEYDSQRPQDAGNAGETQQQPRVQVESTPAGSNIPYVQAYDTQTGKPLGSQQVVNKHTVVKTKTKKVADLYYGTRRLCLRRPAGHCAHYERHARYRWRQECRDGGCFGFIDAKDYD
ncbi:MAG: hypothetical protein ACLTHL_03465 [Collinsella sp.]